MLCASVLFGDVVSEAALVENKTTNASSPNDTAPPTLPPETSLSSNGPKAGAIPLTT